ncbi:MAG: type II toxin-antitoxin system VapC family toxin [Rhizobiaceae bacterium]|nr:type II toxin-antitoxin system VapC family toxin [Rhizobiaceae bacterium]
MTSTLIDTNIFIDILGTGPFFEPVSEALLSVIEQGDLIVSPVVWAELAYPGIEEQQLFRKISWMRPRREAFPFEAAFPAGRAHRLYRQRGGLRERTLPDFLIGAHALVAGHRLLTRDPARYRSYFPDLAILAPEILP